MRSYTSVEAFYNALAPHYHLVYEDWERSMKQQGDALDELIKRVGRGHLQTMLDVACGIGTQAMPLAKRGYSVTASDISRLAVERARLEAEARRLHINFSVSDMRSAYRHHRKSFDVVLCGDNAIPHLLSDEEILKALREFFQCTNLGGICIVSLRDYGQNDRRDVEFKPHGVQREAGSKTIVFQVWEWREPLYDSGLYFVNDDGVDLQADVVRSTYYAIPIERMMTLMRDAGFYSVTRHDDVLWQPAIVGHKAPVQSSSAG